MHGAGLYSLGAAEEEAEAAEDEDEDDEAEEDGADAPAAPEPPLPPPPPLLPLPLLPMPVLPLLLVPLPAAVCGPQDAMSWSILAQTKSPTPVRHFASEPLVMWRG